jgi:hypothetical protein
MPTKKWAIECKQALRVQQQGLLYSGRMSAKATEQMYIFHFKRTFDRGVTHAKKTLVARHLFCIEYFCTL